MRLQVLNAVEDAQPWRAIIARLPESARDIYFSPEWLSLHANGPSFLPVLVAVDDGDRTWAYPFLLRGLSRIGGHKLSPPIWDIESAYGYGGPVANCFEPAFLSDAFAAFSQWCRSQRIVAEFVRLHPLLGNESLLPPEVECSENRDTVSLGLEHDVDVRQSFGADVRYMMRRAERSGVRVFELSPEEEMPRFHAMYTETMQRIGADEYYVFDDSYFEQLVALVRSHGWLLAAVADHRWLAAAVILRGERWMHYHLSARDLDARVPGVTNLLLERAARLGAESGLARFHLGGGVSRNANDPLLRFKSSMADEIHRFRIGKRVHDPETHQSLRGIWRSEFQHIVTRYGERLLCYHERE